MTYPEPDPNSIPKPRRLERSTRYHSNWITVYTDRVELPTGQIVEEYHVLKSSSEAAAGLLENDRVEVLMALVYRYPTDSLEWEIPGGRIDPGETPVQAAQREVREETGWESVDPRPMYIYHPTNGISDQRFHIVHCRATSRTGPIDPHEIHSIRWFSRQEIERMIDEGSLKDGFTLVALLLWLRS